MNILKTEKKIISGNIYSKRDWGHTSDYVLAMWKILQQKTDDFANCNWEKLYRETFYKQVTKN